MIALLVGAAAPAAALAGGPSVRGPSGVGDPFFPKAGNGYYDVQRYDLRLRYAPGTGKLRARALIRAVVDTPDPPGAALRRFNLDYRGPRITSLRVNGRRARHRRSGRELIVKPRRPLADGSAFLVVVRYRGRPRPVFDPDGSQEGWTRTADGAVALGEPRGSPSWFPANDHPTDKARFKIRITVPRPALGISNGALVRRKRRSGRVTTVWRQREPMATYLALVAIGRYRLDRRTVAGQPYLAAADRRYGRGVLKTLRKRTRLAHLLMEDVAGAYPATATGGVIDPSGVGYALETQGRPYYPRPPSRDLVVHEIAHGWYGNSVSPADWSEIWLNEGFATYMEWLDSERSGGQTAAERFDDLYATPSASNAFWNPPPAAVPGPAKLFDDTVYVRGAMALQVLRELVGKADFDQILADWATANAGGTVTTDDLRELIAGVTWSPVPPLFDEWLEQPGKPDPPP